MKRGPLEEGMANHSSILAARTPWTVWKAKIDMTWEDKPPSLEGVQYGFSSSHVRMWELDHKESWAPKNWCFWIVVLKTLESPLDCKEIKPISPKENQSWTFIGKTDAEAKAPMATCCEEPTNYKDFDDGRDWRQEEKGKTEDEMVVWHHWLNEYEFDQALGVGEAKESLACCSPWGCRKSDMTEQLNWTEWPSYSQHHIQQ